MSAHINFAEPAAQPERAEAPKASAANKRSGLQLAKTIAKATGVLVLVPALVNSALDAYQAVANVPTSLQEQTNDELWKQHFREFPLLSQKFQIKQSHATVDMLLEVYSGGDIFVQYGGTPQWFRAEAVEPRVASLFFISSANAQTPPAQQARGSSVLRTTVVRPSVVIDLDRVQSRVGVVAPPPAATSSAIERAYLIAETRDEHGLSATSATNTQVFRAEPGYRFAQHEFRLSGANAATVTAVNPSPDGQSISVTYTIRSGPAYDRWRGWLKGTLQTSQVKIAN
jgi:hypothetical protein